MKKISAPPAKPPKAARPRGRPRSFDREQALGRAMEVFWKKGFESASLCDLTEAMGINPPSLYAAFGDKERLFLEALGRYRARHGESCPYGDEPTARGAIEKLLIYMADELSSPEHPPGCMMVMAAATCSGSSPQMQAVLAEQRAEGRKHLKARIDRGIREGDVPAGTDTGALADFYSTIMTGMSLQARDGATRKSLLGTAERAMSVFPAVAAKRVPRKASRRLAQAA